MTKSCITISKLNYFARKEFVTDIFEENLSHNSNHYLYGTAVITGPEI